MSMTKNNKKMTSMTKTILFAGLIMTLMIPVTGMSIANAANGNNAGKDYIHNIQSTTLLPIDENRLQEINEELNRDDITPEERDSLDGELNDMEANLKTWFQAHENAAKEQQARDAQSILVDILARDSQDSTKQLLNSIPITGIGYDYVHNSLEIIVETEKFNPQEFKGHIEIIRTMVGNDVDVTMSPGDFATFEACSRTTHCDEIEGGVQWDLVGESTPCTVGFAAEFNNEVGFVTAGHCLVDRIDEDVVQPSGDPTVIGTAFDTLFATSGNIQCDCGFVEIDEDEVEMSDNIFGTANPNSVYTDSNDNIVNIGSRVKMSGGLSGVQEGFVTDLNWSQPAAPFSSVVLNLVQTTYSSQGGDSGSPVLESNTNKLAGIHSGSDSTRAYFVPESIVSANMIGLNWLF